MIISHWNNANMSFYNEQYLLAAYINVLDNLDKLDNLDNWIINKMVRKSTLRSIAGMI